MFICWGGINGNEGTGQVNLGSIATLRLVYRAWYYFRLGYSTYLTFLLGYFSTLVTVYYLAVRNMPPLLDLFPHFLEFAVLATVVGAPLAVVIGWIHLKRSRLFSSEQDIGVEANPYIYKLQPGWMKEAWTPVMLAQLKILRRLSEKGGLLTDSEKKEIAELEGKMETLIKGGYVGSPRRELSF
jgi:hypothetical protein